MIAQVNQLWHWRRTALDGLIGLFKPVSRFTLLPTLQPPVGMALPPLFSVIHGQWPPPVVILHHIPPANSPVPGQAALREEAAEAGYHDSASRKAVDC